jgi:peptidyl-prolyl cis-trans isomerase SurA
LKEVQLQRAERVGITVSDELLNQALSTVAENLGITLDELPAALAAENIDYAMYREDSRDDLILEQLQQRDVISRISITPRELEQCLSRSALNEADAFDYNISHILVSVPASSTQQDIDNARKRIEEIRARLDAGEDFARLAVATSHAQTALEGGSLGWRKGSQLPTLFAPIVVKMKPGEYSQPIQSGSGFQIVKLNDMRGAERVMVDQLHLRHILLRPNEILDDAATEQKIIGIRAQIAGGDDFGAIAEAVSEDPASAADGGDLGWVSPGDFVPEFEQVIAGLPLRMLSEPFKTRFGWHLVEILERRSYDTTDEIKREQCAREIRAGKAEEERELWLRRLRDQAFVDVRL